MRRPDRIGNGPMYFSEQALADMRAQLQGMAQKDAGLQQFYLQRNY